MKRFNPGTLVCLNDLTVRHAQSHNSPELRMCVQIVKWLSVQNAELVCMHAWSANLNYNSAQVG